MRASKYFNPVKCREKIQPVFMLNVYLILTFVTYIIVIYICVLCVCLITP